MLVNDPFLLSFCIYVCVRVCVCVWQHTDEVSVLEIESIEFVACLFGVVHIFVDNICGALRVVCNALTYLSDESNQRWLADNGSIASPKRVWQVVCSRLDIVAYRMGPNLPKRSKSCSAVTL